MDGIAERLRMSLSARGLSAALYDGQHFKLLKALHDELLVLASVATPITTIHAAVSSLGVVMTSRTVRRYIMRYMPELYVQHYGYAGAGAASVSPSGRKDEVIAAERKPAQQRYFQKSVLDNENRERANPDSFFGEGASEEFAFLQVNKGEE